MPEGPVAAYIGPFAESLREEGYAAVSIINYVPFIRSFLKDCFGDGPVMLSHLCARDVVRFVQRQAAHLHQKRAKLLTCALRSFLTVCALSRQDKAGLSCCGTNRCQLVDVINSPSHYRGSSPSVRHPPQSGWLDELGRLKGG